MTTASDVIDWDEAMEQCGDDEEFLRELLDDLRGETDAQLAKIEEEIRVGTGRVFEMFYSSLSYSLSFLLYLGSNRGAIS